MSAMLKWLGGVFHDIDGAPSAKRLAFFLLLLLLAFVTLLMLYRPASAAVMEFAKTTQDRLIDLLKWLGGFIVVERAPRLLGRDTPPAGVQGGSNV
jgi:hypothetical protein